MNAPDDDADSPPGMIELRDALLFRALVEEAPVALAMFDREMRYLAASGRWIADYGLVGQALAGRSHYAVFPEIGADWKAVHQRGLAGDVIRREEDRFERSDGRVQWLRWEVRPWFEAHGVVGGILIFTEDITTRKEAELALLTAQAIIDSSVDAIVGKTVQGQITSWNPGAEAMFGYRATEAIGRPMRMLIPPGHEAEEDAILDRVAAGERVEPFTTERQRKDGSLVQVSVSVAPLLDAAGQVRGAASIARDISALKRAEQALLRHGRQLEERVRERTAELELARQRAEAASVAKSAFLANMSHEIRTPLNAITGMAYLLRRDGLTPRQTDRLDRIEAASAHLLEILDAVLDLSKIEAGKLELQVRELQPEQIVDSVVALMRERAASKGLTLRAEADAFAPGLRGDATRLRQALLNYVANAIKFTERGDIVVGARTLRDDREATTVRFEVRDSGIGIAAEAIERLFVAFEQVDNSSTRPFGGVGLGLAITRRLAQMMGGEAGVSSAPGRGSVFWFTAVLAKQPAGQAPSALPSALEPVTKAAGFAVGQHVLLAEDEPVSMEVAAALLVAEGLSVTCARDGEEALAHARTESFDLILLDMQMPGLDGTEAARRIRALPGHARTPIVALTANAFTEDRQRCLDAGMDAFLTKPLEPRLLFATLRRWLQPAGQAVRMTWR